MNIRLEYEAAYDWIGFVPRRDSDTGALTKCFGKNSDKDAYMVWGIEIRQRSTPAFIADAQRRMMDALDRHRTPEAAVGVCKQLLEELRPGYVDPDELVIRNRVSKPLEAYT